MRSRHRTRLDWTTITCLVMCFAVLLGIGYVISMARVAGPAALPNASGYDATPFDFSDGVTRRAFEVHQDSMKRWKFESAPDNCSIEFCRALYEPGLGDGKFRVVEARVAGRGASITQFDFGRGWYPSWEGVLDEERLDTVRRALDAALKTNILPAVGDRIVDASTAVVETCRRGRYHFFQRPGLYSNQASGHDTADAQQRFVALATAILQWPTQADEASKATNASSH